MDNETKLKIEEKIIDMFEARIQPGNTGKCVRLGLDL